MVTVLLTLHILVCLALVGLILLQRSEGGALGMGGGPGDMMTTRGAANILTRSTSLLGAAFFLTSILLTAFSTPKKESVFDGPVPAPASVELAPGDNVVQIPPADLPSPSSSLSEGVEASQQNQNQEIDNKEDTPQKIEEKNITDGSAEPV